MYLKDKSIFLLFFFITLNSYAFDFQNCYSLMQKDIIIDTNAIWSYGNDYSNSMDALRKQGKNIEATQAMSLGLMSQSIREKAFYIKTTILYYNLLDSKFQKDEEIRTPLKERLIDYYEYINSVSKYGDNTTSFITNDSLREDAKNLTRTIRILKDKYKICER